MHLLAGREVSDMDWLGQWDPFLYPVSYFEIETVDPPAADERLTGWLVLAVIALTVMVIWYRFGVMRHSFWCMTAGREIEVRMAWGCVRSCSAFEDRTAIACARRCVDRSFRMQWPPALPVMARSQLSKGA
jgi:hypothetical protein